VQTWFGIKWHVSFRNNEWNLPKRTIRTLARSTNNNKQFRSRDHTADTEFLETELNYLEGELLLRDRKVISEAGSCAGPVILLFAPAGCKDHVRLAGRLRSHWDVVEAASANDALRLISEGTISLVLICNEEGVQLSGNIIRALKNSTFPVLYTEGNSTDKIISRVRAMLRT